MNPDREHVSDVSTVDRDALGGFKAWLTAPPRRPVLRKRHIPALAASAYGLVMVFDRPVLEMTVINVA